MSGAISWFLIGALGGFGAGMLCMRRMIIRKLADPAIARMISAKLKAKGYIG